LPISGDFFEFDAAVISGARIIAFYAAMIILQLVWVILIMPEIKGDSAGEDPGIR
jgi:hypothetical protein